MEKIMKKQIQFVKIMPFALVISSILFIVSLAFVGYKMYTTGFNLGIDFAGGIEIKVKIEQNDVINISEIRSVYQNFRENVNIQEAEGEQNKNVFILRVRGGSSNSVAIWQDLTNELSKKYSNVSILSNSVISGVVSDDNIKLAGLLILASWGLILIYIAIRFDIRYAIPAILSLLHTIVIVFGILVFLNKELTILILSAILTLIGYAINDTIVVFDRIRENMRVESVKPLKEIVNISLNQVLGRTIMTSVSTMIASGAILIWGGAILFDFALTFFIGICIGTYASNFIASSFLIQFMKKDKDKKSVNAKLQKA